MTGPAHWLAWDRQLADAFRDRRPTVVVSPEVTGTVLGPLVAVSLAGWGSRLRTASADLT